MGSFLKDSSGKIKIPSTKIKLVIRPNKYASEWADVQETVFSHIKLWETAGFKFDITSYGHKDEIDTSLQERFLDSIAIMRGSSSMTDANSAMPRNILEEFHDLTIDLGSSADLSFMMSLTPNSFTQVSQPTRVSIGSGRAQILQADVVHEVGHALGFAHEHQRVDRDFYVTKRDESVYRKAKKNNQQVQRDSSFIPFGVYDVNSVMHYPGLFNDKSTGNGIGVDEDGATFFPNKPSNADIFAARFLYNEARIKEYIERAYDNDTTQTLCFCVQDLRLNTLSSKIDLSIDVAQRTYDAVQAQIKQLRELKLQISSLDNDLISWAKKPISQKQPEIKASSAERRVSTNHSSFHRPSVQSASTQRERTFLESIQDSCRIS